MKVLLIHRHARGLALTEQGEHLLRTAREDKLVHHLILAHAATPTSFLNELNAAHFVGRGGTEHVAAMPVNNIPALRRAVENGIGTGVPPGYLNEPESGLVQLVPRAVMRAVDCNLVDPDAMKYVARVGVFRDFLVASAQRWRY